MVQRLPRLSVNTNPVDRHRGYGGLVPPHGHGGARPARRVPQPGQHAARARHRATQGDGATPRPRGRPQPHRPPVADRVTHHCHCRRWRRPAARVLGHTPAHRHAGVGAAHGLHVRRHARPSRACRDDGVQRGEHDLSRALAPPGGSPGRTCCPTSRNRRARPRAGGCACATRSSSARWRFRSRSSPRPGSSCAALSRPPWRIPGSRSKDFSPT